MSKSRMWEEVQKELMNDLASMSQIVLRNRHSDYALMYEKDQSVLAGWICEAVDDVCKMMRTTNLEQIDTVSELYRRYDVK